MGSKLKPISQQVVVITGATSGIGLATARRFAKAGAHLVIAARSETDLRKVAKDLRKKGVAVETVAADVGERDQVKRIAEAAIRRFGGFDTWVNNAGIGAYALLEDISDGDHQRLFQTNYWGVVYGSLEAVKHLKQRGGALINVGSIASEMPSPLLSAYAASKHAVKGFTDSLRLELMHQNAPIQVTLIKPSGIDTPFGEHARNYLSVAARVPPPVYSPELVANAIVHAATTPTRMVTIGGAGLVMSALAYFIPHLSDRLFSALFFKLARNEAKPNRGIDFLHAGGGGGRVRGESRFVRTTSLATTAQTNPWAAIALVAAAAGGLAFLLSRSAESQDLSRVMLHALPEDQQSGAETYAI
jgi:short-subunit dehydrogenase